VSIGPVSQGYSLTSGPQRNASVKESPLASAATVCPQLGRMTHDAVAARARTATDCILLVGGLRSE